jgi:Flp pilus assembly protein TadB
MQSRARATRRQTGDIWKTRRQASFGAAGTQKNMTQGRCSWRLSTVAFVLTVILAAGGRLRSLFFFLVVVPFFPSLRREHLREPQRHNSAFPH